MIANSDTFIVSNYYVQKQFTKYLVSTIFFILPFAVGSLSRNQNKETYDKLMVVPAFKYNNKNDDKTRPIFVLF